MKAVATFHQPTSVVGSVKTTLTDDEDVEYLVVAKSSILEVFAILPDSLRLQCALEIWGRITSLQAIPTGEETSQHRLLVLTDHPDPRLLLIEYLQSVADSGPSLRTLKAVSIYERNARPSEFLNVCLVDHKGGVAIACSYTGKLRVLELESGLISSDFDTSVRELNILSLCFLRTANARATVLAILYRDYMQKLSVTSHDLSLSDLELSPSPSSFLPEFPVPDADSNILVPVPPQTKSTWNVNGGILVLGGSSVAFYTIDRKQKKKHLPAQPNPSRGRVPQAEANWSFFEITAWAQIDEEGTRFLFGDSSGRLALLAIDLEKPNLDILFLGEVSPPTSLTPLSSQFIYVGSHFGDSQLVLVTMDKSSANGSYVDVSKTFKNIAPIMDAVVEDTDNSGHPTIVTCSGGESAGSLRVIRNGANFTEDACVGGITNISAIWPLKKHYDDEYHHYMLVTTDTRSHLLELPRSQQESTVARSDGFADLRTNIRTLAAGNVLNRITSTSGKSEYVGGNHFVQVTRDAVLLLNTRTGTREFQWSLEPGRRIVLADISPSQICIATSEGTAILLSLLSDEIKEQSRKTFIAPNGMFSEISALTITPMKSGARFSSFVVLGFWSSHEVKIYTLPEFEPTGGLPTIMPHLPRSLLLHDFGDGGAGSYPYVMVGLANGTVVSIPFGGKDGLGEKKFFDLGGAPISLSRCEVNNQPAVFASGTRSALFYRSKDTLSHSPVLIKDVTFVSALNSEAFSSSMVLSTLDGLVIGRILELDKLHIRTVFMGKENPTQLAYHAGAKLFGVGCLKLDRSVSKAAISSFKLIDASDFRSEFTHEFSLEPNEEISAVALVSLEHENGWDTFFALGSTYFDESEREPSRGRVLLISTGTNRNQSPHIFATAEARGAVNALTCIKGQLVVAINTSVDIFRLISGDNNQLTGLTSWNHNYLVISAVAAGDQIVIGDAVSSLAVLKLEEDKLSTVARDYSPVWPLCIGVFDRKTVIGANNDNNLFSYRLQERGKKMFLDQDGLYNIDETVNKCVPACFDSAPNKFGLQTRQLLFTTTGRIAVVVDVKDDLSRLLSGLERNLGDIIRGPGDVDHAHWRAPSNSLGRSDAHSTATGFLDGDLLERFLDYPASSPEVARALSGKNEAERIETPYTEIRAILESLCSTH